MGGLGGELFPQTPRKSPSGFGQWVSFNLHQLCSWHTSEEKNGKGSL